VILEVAQLAIVKGREDEFEKTFAEARRLVANAPGFLGLELQRCVEEPSRYVLLARWRAREDHTERFRGSKEYERWRELLHPFFDGAPGVLHYETVASDA
jgi:heme-degrading monooxygenase HmoA